MSEALPAQVSALRRTQGTGAPRLCYNTIASCLQILICKLCLGLEFLSGPMSIFTFISRSVCHSAS